MTDSAGRDERVEIAIHHWAPRFVAAGVPLSDFDEVTARIDRWDDWCAVWSKRAAVHEALGREALAEGYSLSAAGHLTRASLCYHFGKFMFVHKPEEMRRAHQKIVECRDLALPHLDPPGERASIPFEGKTLYGILRKPRGVERAPVVVMCVGLDSTKEELDGYESIFLDRGMATLVFDGPGQGEAEYEIPIRGDYEAPVQAVIDYIETRNDLDVGRVGIMGVSLGGYYSARAAAFDKRIKACLSFSGPYSWVDIFDGRNELSRVAFRVRSHSKTMEEAREKAKTLTLAGAAKNITCPIYIVGGELDRLTPPANAERIAAEVSGPKVLLIVKGGNHVVNNRRYAYQTQAADWMAQQLKVLESRGGVMGRSLKVFACAALIAAGPAHAAEADKYPARPVRVITGSPGSTSDQIARFTAQKLTERLGQQFIVDNRAGAGGTIGTDIVAKSVPDGHTLTIAHAGTHVSAVSLFKNLPYDPLRDFAPISILMKGVTVLVAHPSTPANSVQELIALGKAKGGNAVTWGSAGPGTISHLAGELFINVTGVKFLHVPYKGAGFALTGLLSGETQFAFLSPVTAHVQLQAKKVKAFTVTSLQRFPGTPDIPSATEAGVPGLDALLWFGIMAPAKTPQSIVMKLNREINDSFSRPDAKETLLKLGAIASPSTPEEMRAFIKAELAKWTPVIKAAGITAQ